MAITADLKEAHSWYNPPDSVEINQIAGITTDSQGNIAVFHRGTNGWDESSFDSNNVYVNQQECEYIKKVQESNETKQPQAHI